MRAATLRSLRLAMALACVLAASLFSATAVFAQDARDPRNADRGGADAGIFQGSTATASDLRSGNITFDDIPNMIMAVTQWVLGLAATVAVFAIIFGALKLTLGSGAFGDSDGKTEAKNALQYGIVGFVVAVSGWLMVQFVLSNL